MRWWGAAQRAHDIAAAYACERLAFGKPIIEHEGVGFMLADNLIDLKQSELMIDWCAGVLDAGHTATTESSMTKVAVSEALFRIADRCVQVLGGIGVTRDTVVEQVFFARSARFASMTDRARFIVSPSRARSSGASRAAVDGCRG